MNNNIEVKTVNIKRKRKILYNIKENNIWYEINIEHENQILFQYKDFVVLSFEDV